MKMKKWIALALGAAISISMAACGSENGNKDTSSEEEVSLGMDASSAPEAEAESPEEQPVLKIAAIKGPSSIGMVKLMQMSDAGESAGNYEFTLVGSAQEVMGDIVKGEYDIVAVPTNLAPKLYEQTQGQVKMAALNTMGVLYIVENGDTVKSIADLKDQTVLAAGQGSTPEYVLNFLLKAYELTPGENVQVEYQTEQAQIATMLAAEKAKIAMLPQPFVTTALEQNDKLRVALDLTTEWEKVAPDGSGLTMGCIIVQQKLIEEHPQALEQFLGEYNDSIQFVTTPGNIDEAAQLTIDYQILGNLEVAKKAIPECNIVFKAGDEMKQIASGFFEVLFKEDPASIGGNMPDEGLYYTKEQSENQAA